MNKRELFMQLKEDVKSNNDFLVNNAYKTAFKEFDRLIGKLCHEVAPASDYDFMLRDDMIQNAHIAIAQNLQNYNGSTEPSTYFFSYIKAAIRTQQRVKNDVTQHYQNEYSKILAAEEELKRNKHPVSIVGISILSGLSFEIIRNATEKVKGMSAGSIEEMSEAGFDVRSDKIYEQPQKAMVKKEEFSILQNIIKNDLSELEKDVISHAFFENNDKYTLRTKLRNFSKENGVTMESANKAYNSALQKFQKSSTLQKFIGESCSNTIKFKKNVSFVKETKEEIEGQITLSELFLLKENYKVKTEKIERYRKTEE